MIITTSSQEIAGKEKVQNPGHNIRLDPLQLTDCKGTQSHPFSPMQTFGPLPFSMMLHIAKYRPITSTAGFCVTFFWEGVKITFKDLGKDPVNRSDEFLEKFQTAFDPPPSFLENYVANSL